LNAGIDDRDDIFNSTSNHLDNPPAKPNMKTFEVNLFGPYYGVKLAAHYMALNKPMHGDSNGKGGRIVITASDAGLWALPAVPQYTATKHAVVGLVRALAASATEAGVSINAVAPALTPSNLAPAGLLESYPKEALTKMETLMVVEGRGEDIHYKNEIEKTNGREVPKGESCMVVSGFDTC
jgi:15-hydroxyprostaglandin dehydrogenase (NAD)